MRSFARIALGLLVTGTGLLVALVLTGAPVVALDVVYDALLLGAPVLCFARVVASRKDRVAWALVGVGTLAWALGDLYWTFFIRGLEEEPFPSVADGLWLGFYPPVYVALILLLRVRLHHLRAQVWLDGLIGALAVGAVATAVVFEAVAATSEGTNWAIATNIAYPLADTILLALVVGAMALSGWRADRALAGLAAGFFLFGASDALYLYQVATDTYVEWTLLDAGWPAAVVLMATAAWQPSAPRRTVDEGPVTLTLPAVFAGLGLAVLVWDHFTPIHTLALALAAAGVLAVIARMAFTVAENLRMIRRSREEALTDALTGLGNRRRLMLDLESVFAGPAVESTALIVLDLNGFKAYNDIFGHPAGDALLARLGARLCAVARGRGQAYRLGGDEFCALLAASDIPLELLEQACTSALRENGEGFHVSAAEGAVLVPDEATDTSTALKLADQRMYARKHGARGSAGAQTSSALLQALTERSPDLGDHVLGVADLAVAVGRKLGLTDVETEEVRLGASLHDVGKMAIPDAIIGKPGPLTEDEWHFVRNHTVAGEKILGAAPALQTVAKLVRSSHERYDGTGYPDGLAGSEIPLGSRIIFVCDAFDAIIAERVYRGPRTVAEAIEEIRRCAGTQFDPDVVAAFVAVMDERSRLLAA